MLARTPNAIEFNLVLSLSALDVNIIGALDPTIKPAFSHFAKYVIDLYKIFPASISGTTNISAFPATG